MELNCLCNFGRGHYWENSHEIILNLDQWFKRKGCLKKKFMDDAYKMKTDHKCSSTAFGSGELNNNKCACQHYKVL